MAPPDDLHPDLPPASAGISPPVPANKLKEVGPESEVRGGSQAPDTTPPSKEPTR